MYKSLFQKFISKCTFLCEFQLRCIGPCQFSLILCLFCHFVIILSLFSIAIILKICIHSCSSHKIITISKLFFVCICLLHNCKSLHIIKIILFRLQSFLLFILFHLHQKVLSLFLLMSLFSIFFVMIFTIKVCAPRVFSSNWLWQIVRFSHI